MSGKRYVVILNPHSGRRRGPAVLAQVRPVFAQAGMELDVRMTTRRGHAFEVAQTLDFAGVDGVCVVGGDGSVHEVAAGLMKRGAGEAVPLGVIPSGSGNNLHEHFHGGGPEEAARRIVAGNTAALDVARVSMHEEVLYCIDMIGWGAVVDVSITAEGLRMLGPLRYSVAALRHIVSARRRRARLILDGKSTEDEFLFIVACNAKYIGRGMKMAAKAEVDDGKIDVVAVRHATRLQLLNLFTKVFDGSHISSPCVEYHQVSSFAIETHSPQPLDLDGENKGASPVSVQMQPGALRVFI